MKITESSECRNVIITSLFRSKGAIITDSTIRRKGFCLHNRRNQYNKFNNIFVLSQLCTFWEEFELSWACCISSCVLVRSLLALSAI